MVATGHNDKNKSFAKVLFAGGTSGAIEATIVYPTEFVKTQLQLQSKSTPRFKGPLDCVAVTLRENGPLGLYRGLSTLIIGSVMKTGVRFTAFEQFSSLLMDKQTGKLSPTDTFFAGFGAGMCEAIFPVTPVETIKTKLIHDQNRPVDQRQYRGLIHGVSTIVKNEGVGGIYKGLVPTMLKQGTNQATRFLVFKKLKDWFQGGNPAASFGPLHSLLCGGIAGAISVFVNNPVDVIKTKMQGLEASNYKNSFDCARVTLVNQGPLFFYKGVTPRLVRVTGDAAITFTVYEQLCKLYDALVEMRKR